MNEFIEGLNFEKTILENKIEKVLFKIKKNNDILIIGTGGSYITGLLFKKIMEECNGNNCTISMPFDLYKINFKKFKYAVIFSYSLNNYDSIFSIKKLINENNIKKIIVVTANNHFNIDSKKIIFFRYQDFSKIEQNYIAFNGIYTPIAIILSAYNKFYNINKHEIENNIPIPLKGEIVHVFYDLNNYYLAELIERHFTELGIAMVKIHEKRDFAHGRMNLIKDNEEIIYLKSSEYDFKYDSLLYKYLLNTKRCKDLWKNQKFQDNLIENIITILAWIQKCAEVKKINIKKIKDSNEARKLFEYRKD